MYLVVSDSLKVEKKGAQQKLSKVLTGYNFYDFFYTCLFFTHSYISSVRGFGVLGLIINNKSIQAVYGEQFCYS